MIIQFILCAGLSVVLLYAYLQRRKSSLVSIAIIVVSVAGMAAVLSPSLSNAVASAVGVGRGADLVVYCWIVITLLVTVNLQFKILQMQQNVTTLTRELALRAPMQPDRGRALGGPGLNASGRAGGRPRGGRAWASD